MNIVSIGEILWDVYENEEHIGGAPFNCSVHLKKLGHQVYFISSVGNDKRGLNALKYIQNNDITTKFVQQVNCYPTGYVEVKTGVDGSASYIIHRPMAYDFPSLTSEQLNDIISFLPDWLYFGTVQQMGVSAHELTCNLVELLPKTKCFYDMNLRDDNYTKDLVKKLLMASSIVKLNADEVRICCELFEKRPMELRYFCEWAVEEFKLEGVCITTGPDGCATYLDGKYLESPGYREKVVDSVGAGDAFSAGLLHGLSKNWKLDKVCDFANRLGAIIIKKKGAIPDWTLKEVFTLSLNTNNLVTM